MGGVSALPLPVPRQVGFRAEGFSTLRAFVGLHRGVEPLVFEKLKAVLEAPPTQRTVVCDSSPWVDGLDRRFPGRRRCRGSLV